MQVISRSNRLACISRYQLHLRAAEVTAAIAVRGLPPPRSQPNDHEAQVSLAALKNVVRRMAAMPGQRSHPAAVSRVF